MPATPPENSYLLKPGDVVNIGVNLPDMTFAESLATVTRSEAEKLVLQLCGGGFPQHTPVPSGSTVLISRGEGKTLSQSTARLIAVDADGTMQIELPRRVVVNERRAYMRVDLSVPVHYSLPQNQNMAKVISEWEHAKEFQEMRQEEAEPLLAGHISNVNLSGSGVRFKVHDCLSHGTLLHLKIALPGEKPEHIHAVGSIVRTTELPAELNSHKHYSTSISFRMIDSSDRHRLTRHILDEQRKTVMRYSDNSL